MERSSSVEMKETKAQLSQALFEFHSNLSTSKSGTLTQIWLPDVLGDGTVVLTAQGLPFAISGVGDLLALYRCVSCRYRFATDVMKPTLMGAPGRVFATAEPEMSHNVQKYDKKVYLRVSEAQRCKVHATLVMPVFLPKDPDRVIAVVEMVQNDRDMPFPQLLRSLTKALEGFHLRTVNVENAATVVGLRKWPMEVDEWMDWGPGQTSGSLGSKGRLLLENDVEDDDGDFDGVGKEAQIPQGTTESGLNLKSPLEVSLKRDPQEEVCGDNLEEVESRHDQMPQHRSSVLKRCLDVTIRAGDERCSVPGTPFLAPPLTGDSVHPTQPSQEVLAALTSAARVSALQGVQQQHLETSSSPPQVAVPAGQPANTPPPQVNPELLNLSSLLASSVANILSAQAKQAICNMSSSSLASMATGTDNPSTHGGSSAGALLAQASIHNTRKGDVVVGSSEDPSTHGGNSVRALLDQANNPSGHGSSAALQLLTQLATSQPKVHGTASRAVPKKADTKAGVGDSVLDTGELDGEVISDVGSSDDEDMGERAKVKRTEGSITRYNMHLAQSRALGAGRKLSYEDLQGQFGLGLKEAAANLGICATTLKRACRRNGITRWPRRQIAKLSRALSQMGYQSGGVSQANLVQQAALNTLYNSSDAPQRSMSQTQGTNTCAPPSVAPAVSLAPTSSLPVVQGWPNQPHITPPSSLPVPVPAAAAAAVPPVNLLQQLVQQLAAANPPSLPPAIAPSQPANMSHMMQQGYVQQQAAATMAMGMPGALPANMAMLGQTTGAHMHQQGNVADVLPLLTAALQQVSRMQSGELGASLCNLNAAVNNPHTGSREQLGYQPHAHTMMSAFHAQQVGQAAMNSFVPLQPSGGTHSGMTTPPANYYGASAQLPLAPQSNHGLDLAGQSLVLQGMTTCEVDTPRAVFDSFLREFGGEGSLDDMVEGMDPELMALADLPPISCCGQQMGDTSTPMLDMDFDVLGACLPNYF